MEKKELSRLELIELAKKPLKKMKQLVGDYNDVQKFSIMNKIQTDKNNPIPTYLIYELYVIWAHQNDADLLSRGNFFKIFASMFERSKKNGDIHYLVNGQGLTLSEYSSSQKEIMKNAYSKRISANGKKKENAKKAKQKL